jgi:hypothetical protein
MSAAAAAGALVDAVPGGHNVELLERNGVLVALIDGQERWCIDPSRFAGKPVLETALARDRASFDLRGAYYPGTRIAADLQGAIWQEHGVWLIELELKLGSFRAKLPFIDWVLREAPAVSPVYIPQNLSQLGPSEQLTISGPGTGFFLPSWSFRFDGRSCAVMRGIGTDCIADIFNVSLPSQDEPSLFESADSARSIITLHGINRDWDMRAEFPTTTPWALSTNAGMFNVLQIEATERPGSRAAVLARSTDPGTRLSLYPGDLLLSPDGGKFQFDLEQPRYAVSLTDGERQSVFMADFSRAPLWAHVDGIAMEFGGKQSSPPFEIAMRDGVLERVRITPSVLRIIPSLYDDTVSVAPIEICGTPEITISHDPPDFFQRLKCKLGLCNSSELCIPMHGSRMSVLRHIDLLKVDFEFVNLALYSFQGESLLARTLADGKTIAPYEADPDSLPESLIIVHFPPQNIFEQAFFEGQVCDDCDPDKSKDPATPATISLPSSAQISGSTRLSFRMVQHDIPYTLESLLNLSQFEMKVVPTAVPSGERPPTQMDTTRPIPPSTSDTAIELPYRVYLSPNAMGGWANRRTLPKLRPGERIELWHTRLGVRHNGEVDEEEGARRTLRAIWSEDCSLNPCLPQHNPSDPPFRGTLDVRDRVELVELTSNFHLKDPRDPQQQRPYQPRPISAERLMLSAAGGWLKSTGTWEPPLTENQQALTVELWKHVATMGRDHYVRVEYKGYLMPFGYPCTLVKVTERKFRSAPDGSGPVAVLMQRLFIVIKQEEKKFAAPAQQHDGRGWPFKRVLFEKNYTTPPLDEACNLSRFWPTVTKQDHIFRYKVEDQDGTLFDCSSPLMFVDATVAFSGCTFPDSPKSVCTVVSRCGVVEPFSTDELSIAIADYNNAGLSRRKVAFRGQKVGFAPSKKQGDTQFITDSITFRTEPLANSKDCLALFAADQAPFYPALEKAEIHVDSITQLTGDPSAIEIAYHQTYLDAGFNDSANKG